MINNMLLQLQLIGQLIYRIEHIVSLAVEVLLAAVECVLHFAVFGPEALEAGAFVFKLFL